MDTQQKSTADETMDMVKKTPENAPLDDFGVLINKKIDEIETLLITNQADNQKSEEVHRRLEESFAMTTEKEILTAVEQLSIEIEKEYNKKQKNISDDAEHVLADIENIPPLKTKTLQKIAEDHKIDPNSSVENIIQKLRDTRDGVTETKKSEPASVLSLSKDYGVAKEDDELLKKMRIERVFLREKIKGEEAQTSKESEPIKRLHSELLDLDKQIKQEETTEPEQIAKVKEKIENVLSIKKPEEKIETIVPKTTAEEIPQKKNTNTGFSWIKNILSRKEDTKNTKQNDAPIISTPAVKPPLVEKNSQTMSVTEEILQQGKEIPQPEQESSLRKPSESYLVKEGDTIRKIMEIQLTENKNFNNLTPRQKNFLLDSAEETFRKSRIPIISGNTVNLDAIFKENRDIARILKKE